MSGPRDQSVRSPAVAGMFYPAEAAHCRSAAGQLVSAGQAVAAPKAFALKPAGRAVGAIVPHAGWICSGAIAAEAMSAAAVGRSKVDLVVIFGAIHTPVPVELGVLDTHGIWAVPGGESKVQWELRDELAGQSARFVVDDRFHLREHAVEVELPLIQEIWPAAMILPIETPANLQAVDLGRAVARVVAAGNLSVVYLASSDLTHYGPDYHFAPVGVGEAALQWAMENDQRLLQVVTDMAPEQVVPEVMAHANACGAGAIAAMMAACLEGGAKRAVVLRHQNSRQMLAAVAPQPPINSVGYASVWVG